MLRKFKIGLRLGVGFGILCALIILMGVIAITKVNELKDGIDRVVNDRMVKTRQANSIIDAVNLSARAARNIVILRDAATIQKELARVDEASAIITKTFDSLEETIKSEEGRKLLKEAQDSRATYRKELADYLELVKAGKMDEATVFVMGDMRNDFNIYLGHVNELVNFQTSLAENDGKEALASANQTINMLLIVVIFVLVLAGLASVLITRSIVKPLRNVIGATNKMSEGDFEFELKTESKDEVDEVVTGVQAVQKSVARMIQDAQVLAKAALEGRLSTRADASKHQGDFQKVVQGVNNTLDSVIGPLNVAADYVDQISKGAIPAKITDNYNGDFNAIKDNLNTCIDAVNHLVEDAAMLSKAAVEGRLSTRADASKHQGDFRKVVQGVNDTLDSVIGPLNVAADYVDQISKGAIPFKITDNYNGDFNTIKNNLNTCIDAVNHLVDDAVMLSKAAVEGRLSTRADASKHQGDFARIVQGVNETLDSVIQPITVLQKHLERVAQGDLTAFIQENYQGDHALLKNALNSSLDSLNEILGQVASSSQQVQIGSGELSSASQTVSQGATESAASIEEISSSMAELSAQTKQNAENASVANQLASGARSTAEVGNKQMENMVSAMTEIEGASRNISKIIKVIDEIAFQTNLLALNAAVEAARAGVHGKGFAVVAEEVRNLAARSAKAAKETTEMIESTISKVSNGSSIATETQRSLKEIVGAAARVSDLVSEINVASNEQSLGLQQVNQGISQLDAVTQQNSAAAEEAAASSEELNGQAEILIDAIGKFKLKGVQQIASTPRIASSRTHGITSGSSSSFRSTPAIKTLNSSDIIDLDDPEFGKF